MCSSFLLGQERSLDVETNGLRADIVGWALGDCCLSRLDAPFGRGDDRRAEGCDAGFGKPGTNFPDRFRILGEVGAERTVDLDVHEPGDHGEACGIDVRCPSRCCTLKAVLDAEADAATRGIHTAENPHRCHGRLIPNPEGMSPTATGNVPVIGASPASARAAARALASFTDHAHR